jgi:hypothetical protein
MRHTSQHFDGFEFSFGRVNVILGANGTGKSRLLIELRNAIPKIYPGAKPVFIEGGRAIKIADVLQFDPTNFKRYDRLESAQKHYNNKRNVSLADRVFDALVVMELSELQVKATHSDEVEAWHIDGRRTDYPQRGQPPLTRLCNLFTEIFPKITLNFDHTRRQLVATKQDSRYGPSRFSDGEKQVFSILADLIGLDEVYKVVIADEPELNSAVRL